MDIKYYGKECSIHPFIKREAITGNFFDPRFKRFYGDIDLSLRIWAAGGTVQTCSNSCITMFNNRDKIKREALTNFYFQDEEEFKKKWDEYDFSLPSNAQTPGTVCPVMPVGSFSL
jgi:hypothetical protein